MVTCRLISSREEIEQITDYIALTIETTGRYPETDKIIEIGMVQVAGDKVVNKASTYIDPEMPIPGDATLISGITDADVAGAATCETIAPSIANLVLGTVVISPRKYTDMRFLTAMLNDAGYDGQIDVLDLETYAAEVKPGLPDYEIQTMAEAMDLSTKEKRLVLEDSLLCHKVFQRCKELAGIKQPKREELKKAGRLSGLTERLGLSSSSARHQVQEEQKSSRWLQMKDIPWIVGAAICLIFAVIFFPSISSLLLLIAAVMALPIPIIRRLEKHDNLTGWRLVALCSGLLILALLLRIPGRGNPREIEQTFSPGKLLILSWNKPGDYGEEITLNEGTEFETKYIAFRLPTGSYRVLNHGSTTVKVTVYNDKYERGEHGELHPLAAGIGSSVSVLAGNNKDILVDEEQYVVLSDEAENIIFKYLAELPEETTELGNSMSNMQSEVKAYVNATEVNFRSSASLNGYILTTFDPGQEVIVLGATGDWTQVKVDNQTGFIYSRYLSSEPPEGSTVRPANPSVGTATPTPTPEADEEAEDTADAEAPADTDIAETAETDAADGPVESPDVADEAKAA